MWIFATVAGIAVATLVGGVLIAWSRKWKQCVRLRRAKEQLHRRREWLEAEFLSLASASGKPRSLVWADCDFQDAVALARDRHSGQLRALVGVTITFAPAEGDGSADPDVAVSHCAATAVFRFDGSAWTTDGRAIFNLNPAETIERYGHELEVVE